MRTRLRFRFRLAALVAACLVAASPLGAMAGDGPQAPAQPPPGGGNVVVEPVYNGPLFGAEFKFTELGGEDAYLFGGYAGVVFDNKLFIGGAGYWQLEDGCYGYGDDYYGYSDCHNDYYYDYGDSWYHGVNGYGGLMVEWYALRSSAVSVSARGLVGGGVAHLGWDDYYVPVEMGRPQPQHGGGYPPPPGGYYSYAYDQGYFVFEPQVNVTLRLLPGLAVVGGVGYRVIGWANGWEDQLQGLTGTFAIRFGGK